MSENPYPPIADYAMIGDCHCSALVSRAGSIDRCCMPRIDDDSCFGRLLDWNKGGFCAIAPTDAAYASTRRYIPGTMLLETRFRTKQGEAALLDFFAMDADPLEHPRYDHVRVIDGISGEVELLMEICPRFDFGEIIPRMRRHEGGMHTAIGGNKGLFTHADVPLQVAGHRDLSAVFRLRAGQRVRLVIEFQFPELIDAAVARGLPDAAELDRCCECTRAWWTQWAHRIRPPFELDSQTLRSAAGACSATFRKA